MDFESEILHRDKQVDFLGNPEKERNFLYQENVVVEVNLEEVIRRVKNNYGA